MKEKDDLSRRDFMKVATWSIGGLIGLGMGLPAIAYVVGPALKSKQAQEWIRLGSTAKVELGVPTLFKAKVKQQTGWIINEEELSVYILTEDALLNDQPDGGQERSRDGE